MSIASWKDALRGVLDVSPLDGIRLVRRLLTPRRGGLSVEKARLLETMRSDNANAGPPYVPSPFWRDMLAKHFEEYVSDQGLMLAEEQEFNFYFSGFPPSDARLHRYVCWLYQRSLESRDQLHLLDRMKATCREGRGFAYRFGERVLSLDLLLSIDDFYNLCELRPAVIDQPVVIAELGAGWGRLAHVALSVNPRCTYLIFDLPEPLLISQAYLPRLLGSVSTVGYEQSAQFKSLSKGALSSSRLWFLGAHHLGRLAPKSVDICINVASFQEMPTAYVRQYMEHFSSIAAGGHAYLRQLVRRETHGHSQEEIAGLAAYPFPENWKQQFLRSARLSDEHFEAGFAVREWDDPRDGGVRAKLPR